MKFPVIPFIALFWLNMLAYPVKAQEQPNTNTEDTVNLQSHDSVPSAHKKTVTEFERLEHNNQRYLKRAVIPSAALIATGILTIEGRGFFSSHHLFNYRNETFPEFSTEADDFIMLAPLVGLYGFNLISSENRHELGRQTVLLIASGVITSAMVWPTKKLTNIERPNKKPYAFPSGHTAYAFTIATFIDKEFRHKKPWISIASYSIAGATGILRVLNNAHWMSDILAGAGVGILSVNTVYWLHAKLSKNSGRNTAILPVILPNGQPGMSLTIKF